MKTSARGRAAITAREGRRLNAYRDTRGVLTIGVGHTGRMSPPKVTAGMRIDDAQCDAMLAADLAPVEQVLAEAVTVPMTQNEFDAMASLGFNIGVGGLARSSVVRKLNLGDVSGAADAFLAWSKPAVLAARRKAERAQFLKPDEATQPDDAVPTSVTIGKRAAVLAGKSGRVAADARFSSKVVAASATVTVAAAAIASSSPRGHIVPWLFTAFCLVAAFAVTLLAILGHRKATTLATNAEAHARAAQKLDAGTTDIVDALQQ